MFDLFSKLLCLWDFLDKNTGVGCHFFLQGIFLTQELNLLSCVAGSLLHHRFFLPLSQQGSPSITYN